MRVVILLGLLEGRTGRPGRCVLHTAGRGGGGGLNPGPPLPVPGFSRCATAHSTLLGSPLVFLEGPLRSLGLMKYSSFATELEGWTFHHVGLELVVLTLPNAAAL